MQANATICIEMNHPGAQLNTASEKQIAPYRGSGDEVNSVEALAGGGDAVSGGGTGAGGFDVWQNVGPIRVERVLFVLNAILLAGNRCPGDGGNTVEKGYGLNCNDWW